MNKYIVRINWESEEIEVYANNKEEARDLGKIKANMSPNMDYVEAEVIKWQTEPR